MGQGWGKVVCLAPMGGAGMGKGNNHAGWGWRSHPPAHPALPHCHPLIHITTFKTTMYLQGVLDEIMCRAFPTTLKGLAQVCFSKIPPNTVSSFQKLSKLFVNNFIGGQRYKHSSSSLLTIKQGDNESLRSFITHFNREALTVDEMDDKLLLAAFHNGVSSDLFNHKLYD